MARLLSSLVALVVAVGCGVSSEGGARSPSTGAVETSPQPPVESTDFPGPPRILLTSAAGTQEAAAGSFCVADPAHGVNTCGDAGPVYPVELTVVRPGDEVSVALDGASVVRAENCHSETGKGACIGEITIRPLGCERTTRVVPLTVGTGTRFALDVAPGGYEVDVFAYFAAEDRRTGDVSGSLGVLVDEQRPLEVLAASAEHRVCADG
jgi:hypothetical protein